MSRRDSGSKTTPINLITPVGDTVLIAPTEDFIINPSKVCIAGIGSGNATADFKSVYGTGSGALADGSIFLSMAIGSYGTECVDLGSYELAKSSGLAITVGGADIRTTVFYTPIDESPGVTKVASRATSYQNSLGEKATRTPGVRGIGDLS